MLRCPCLQVDITEAIEGVIAQQNSLAHQMGQLQQAVAALTEQQQQQPQQPQPYRPSPSQPQPQQQQQSPPLPPQRAAAKPFATLFD